MIPLKDDVEADSFPIVNLCLIIANIIVFAYTCGLPQSFYVEHCLVPSRFAAHCDLQQISTSFQSQFLHAGIFHLLGNMWFLWIFGDNVEDGLGHIEYLVFYLLCGFGGDIAHVLVHPTSTLPCLGASGAIAGVMGAYVLLYPHAKVKVLWDDFWIWTYSWPAWVIIGEWWVLQALFGVVLSDSSSNVGYMAHLGGFAAGMILIMLFSKRELQATPQEARW